MNKRILLWSVTAALAGFLFGFDTVVISGADKKLQALWGSSDAFHGSVVMAMALWGTVFGAIFGGIPTNRLGRKTTLSSLGRTNSRIHAIHFDFGRTKLSTWSSCGNQLSELRIYTG